MRDYFLYPAQTNLELFTQAIGHGYDKESLSRLAEAYRFALRQVYPLVRGSGKPFIAHLVGTASLVLESAKPLDWVLAALMHALYQRRIPFEKELATDARRTRLASRFGSNVDDLVYRYTMAENSASSCELLKLLPDNPDVMTILLADELEDLCGYALALHGSQESNVEAVRGGYLWRKQAKIDLAPMLFNATDQMKLEGMARSLRHWLDFASYPTSLKAVRTGLLSSALIEKDISDL